MTTTLLTRHGQTEWNREERFRGRIDVPLNATGERQAAALAERLTQYSIAAIYTGPMQRVRRTGGICAARLGLQAQVLPHLLDADYGAWQGLSPAEISERYPDLWRLYLSAPQEVHFPAGETLVTLQERVVAVMEEAIPAITAATKSSPSTTHATCPKDEPATPRHE